MTLKIVENAQTTINRYLSQILIKQGVSLLLSDDDMSLMLINTLNA
jgi:hypothetical protein